MDLMIALKRLINKNKPSSITQKLKDSIGLKKIEERDRQFLIENIIHSVEFKNWYKNSVEKKRKIIETVEIKYKIIIRVYQNLYADIAHIFFEYIHILDPDEIEQLVNDIKNNGRGVINSLEIDNSLELLSTF